MALAHDPLRNEDVQIGDCHPVHAAEGADGLHDDVVKVLERSFSHDPCEGCQGNYRLLVRAECPECGCNRAERSVLTLGGIVTEACAACGHVHTQA